MWVFIDANIFLSFYHMTGDDLEELEKLAVLIENKEIDLITPQQTIDEVRRNRASKINSSLVEFKKSKSKVTYPAYCKDYDHYDEMRTAQKKFNKLHSEMLGDIESDIEQKKLKADILIDKLFSLADVLEITPKIVDKAKIRSERGNPPGKKDSLGDAIIWETLLSDKRISGIYFITGDSDFVSPLNSEQFCDFLSDEWSKSKTIFKGGSTGTLKFYRNLSQFFTKHFPGINLKTETEKDELIEALTVTGSFSETHVIISKLSKYDGFTQKQKEDLIDALLSNHQISWIGKDEDINAFYRMLHKDDFSVFFFHDEYDRLKEIIFEDGEEVDDIPF